MVKFKPNQAAANSLPPLQPKFLGDSASVDNIARLTGFMRRKPRKITAHGFLHAIIHSALNPSCSLRDIAIKIGVVEEDTVSRQALWKRLGNHAFDFLSACLAQVLSGAPESNTTLSYLPSTIRRVLVADSTLIALHPSLASCFPGASNQTGKKQSSARIQVMLDLVSGCFIDFQIGSFRDNDQKAAFWSAQLVRAGDLILRDLGYFTLNSLQDIADKGAYFITRLRLDCSLYQTNGKPLDLISELHSKTSNIVAIQVFAGTHQKLSARLVAVRLSPEDASRRRQKAKADRDKRLKWSNRRAELLGWSITLDNLPAEVPAKRIYPIYGLRWRIETVFKAWKSHLGMRQPLKPIGQAQAKAYLCAALIGVALAVSSYTWIRTKCTSQVAAGVAAGLSLLKCAPMIRSMLCNWLVPEADDPHALLRQIKYHGSYDKRQKRNHYQQIYDALLCSKPCLS